MKQRKKRVTQKMIDSFIEKSFNIIPTTGMGLGDAPDSYVSKIDGAYMTFVGLEDDIKFLLKKGITEQLQNQANVSGNAVNIGFNPEEQKWYGWSHRAIFGFGIGSECKKGHCHYIGSSLKELEEAAIAFWDNEYHVTTRCEGIIEHQNGDKFFDIKWKYDNKVPNKKIRGTTGGVELYITPLGKGEWIANTLEDAKQMAKDFAKGVS